MGFRTIRPPDDGELLAYLDGELDPKRRAQVERMLESSWEVRARLTAVERDIDVFVGATEPPAHAFPAFDALWASVQGEARAEAPRELTAAERKPSRFVTWRRLATVAAAAALLVAAFVKLNAPPDVSAKVLLGRARQLEARDISAIQAPVVYQKLRIRRNSPAPYRSEAVVWELWRPVAGGQVQERLAGQDGALIEGAGGPDVYADFRRICAANNLDRTRPLSPEAYESWQSRAGARWGRVLRERLPGGDRVYVLEASRDANRADEIVQAALVIREDNGHPVAQRLRVRTRDGAADYELAEDAYRVIEMASVPRFVFPQQPALSPVQPRLDETSALPSPEPIPGLPPVPPTELAASAVEVHFVLHRLGLCQQESLELNRTASGIEMRGSADSEEQRRSIAAAVAHVAHVRFEMSAQARKAGREPGGQEQSPSLLDRYLERARPSGARQDADVHALRDSVLALNGAVSADARALRRLARTFSNEDLAALPIASRWLLNQMFHEHLTAIRKNSIQLGSLLLPVLGTRGAARQESSEAVSPPDWRSQLVSFCDRVELACGLVRGPSGGSAQASDASVRRLVDVLSDTPSGAAALEVAFSARLAGAGENSAAARENSR